MQQILFNIIVVLFLSLSLSLSHFLSIYLYISLSDKNVLIFFKLFIWFEL